MQTIRATSHLRRRRARAVAGLAVVAVLSFVSAAYALYDEDYGGHSVSPGGGYVESAGAHAFVFNSTAIANSGYLACQSVSEIRRLQPRRSRLWTVRAERDSR